MRRFPSSSLAYSFGPGPMTPAVKALIWINIVLYLARLIAPEIAYWLGLEPRGVLEGFRVWQPVTYMFVHQPNVTHILFNMLAVWMIGTELERLWGTRLFVKFYAISGVGAAIFTILFAFLPFAFAAGIYDAVTVGASGAVYGLLLAYGLYFKDRPIYLWALFPIPAKYFVMILGAIAFISSLGGQGGVAHAAHLGGLVAAYIYLKGGSVRVSPMAELKYRYLKWKINRVRKKFDVYSGGRADDWDRRLH